MVKIYRDSDSGVEFAQSDSTEVFSKAGDLFGFTYENEFIPLSSYISYTRYEFRGREFDSIGELNQALETAFIELCEEFDLNFSGDIPACREAFNNWTDGLRSDSELCNDGYNDCTLSDETEKKLTR